MDSLVVLSSALAIRRIERDSSRNPARCSTWLRAKAIGETPRQMTDLSGYAPPLARHHFQTDRRATRKGLRHHVSSHAARSTVHWVRASLARIGSQPVHRALHPERPTVHDMQIRHRRSHIPMPEQPLHGPYVVPRFEERPRKTVPQRILRRQGSRRRDAADATDDYPTRRRDHER